MRISDWSSDVCSSDLAGATVLVIVVVGRRGHRPGDVGIVDHARLKIWQPIPQGQGAARHVHLLSTSPTKSAATDRQQRLLGSIHHIGGCGPGPPPPPSSAKRRSGEEWVSTCRSGGGANHIK